jgi:hypothetical protein
MTMMMAEQDEHYFKNEASRDEYKLVFLDIC